MDIPLGKNLGKLKRTVSHGRDEVERDAGEAGGVDVLVQAFQEVIDHSGGVTGNEHVSSIADCQC